MNMENQISTPMIAKPGAFPAKVAKVIDAYKLVINRGKEHGIREGQRVLIYRIDDEGIIDPGANKSLGNLELVRGSGKIFQVESQYAIVESDQLRRKPYFNQYKTLEERKQQLFLGDIITSSLGEGTLKPFDNPQVGDFVKPI